MSQDPRSLSIADYTYDLPDDRIARYPLPERDASKLLVYRNGKIEEDIFRNVSEHVPKTAMLVLNTAKVVRARMLFQKPTGGIIEIFCLEPDPRYPDISTALAQQSEVYWRCLVGGAAKWKAGIVLNLQAGDLNVQAELISRNKTDFSIHFRWAPDHYSWAEVMEHAGKIPLPPYLHREAETKDEETYQTLFAQHEGSVAAPTASLHFTPTVLESLSTRGIKTASLTLHVGAGTFKPVKSELAGQHEMHGEWIEVNQDTIVQLIAAKPDPIIAAGTTALRTLESLYWMGAKVAFKPDISLAEIAVTQWEPYDLTTTLSVKEALQALHDWLERKGLKRLITRTEILIAPGYHLRVADAVITNFHQPNSTLLLLVAAVVGNDWKKIYDYALSHNFRFLSYGDASLLWHSRGGNEA